MTNAQKAHKNAPIYQLGENASLQTKLVFSLTVMLVPFQSASSCSLWNKVNSSFNIRG